jgi:hypothetical protein
MSVLMPPSMRVAPDHSVNEFMGNVSSMKAHLDKERAKKVKDSGADEDDD